MAELDADSLETAPNSDENPKEGSHGSMDFGDVRDPGSTSVHRVLVAGCTEEHTGATRAARGASDPLR